MTAAQGSGPLSIHWRMLTASATVGALSSIVKIAGAAKIVITARYFGTGDGMDAFLVAFLLPAFVADVIAGSLTPSMVPLLISAEGRGDVVRVARSAAGIALLFLTMAALALGVAAPVLIRVLASNFPPAKIALTIQLQWFLLPWLPAAALISVWRAFLNSRGHFAIPAIAPLATPLMTLLALWASAARFGPYALCLGTLAGVVAECGLLAWAVFRLGGPLRPTWSGWTPDIAEIRRRYVPLVAGVLASSSAVVVDQAIAATFGNGAVSVLAYGTRVVTVLVGVAAAATGTAALPLFSRLAKESGSRVRTVGAIYVGGIFLAGIPLAVLLMRYSAPVVRVLLEHGAFTAGSTEVVSEIQRFALVQVPFGLALALMIRLAVAMNRSSVLGRVAVIGFVVNLACDVLFARWLGIAGIALSTAAVQAVCLLVLAGAVFTGKRGFVG